MLYNLKSGVTSVFKQLKVGLDIQCMCSNLQQNGAMLRGMSTQIIFLVSGASLMFNQLTMYIYQVYKWGTTTDTHKGHPQYHIPPQYVFSGHIEIQTSLSISDQVRISCSCQCRYNLEWTHIPSSVSLKHIPNTRKTQFAPKTRYSCSNMAQKVLLLYHNIPVFHIRGDLHGNIT